MTGRKMRKLFLELRLSKNMGSGRRVRMEDLFREEETASSLFAKIRDFQEETGQVLSVISKQKEVKKDVEHHHEWDENILRRVMRMSPSTFCIIQKEGFRQEHHKIMGKVRFLGKAMDVIREADVFYLTREEKKEGMRMIDQLLRQAQYYFEKFSYSA